MVVTTVKAATLGLLLGLVFATAAALQREAFIPYSAVVVVVLGIAMLISAAGLAFFQRRRPAATFLFVAALTFVAFFYAAVTVIRK